jgi:hypothetical protein
MTIKCCVCGEMLDGCAFRVPKDAASRNDWVDRINLDERESYKLSVRISVLAIPRMCFRHFYSKDIIKESGTRPRLREDAAPIDVRPRKGFSQKIFVSFCFLFFRNLNFLLRNFFQMRLAIASQVATTFGRTKVQVSNKVSVD